MNLIYRTLVLDFFEVYYAITVNKIFGFDAVPVTMR
jgi:hypothetical protein